MMKYAPIIIPTLCRYEHFVRLIESLRRNTWAKYTDIYVGVDYPPSEKYKDGYKKICEYLEGDFLEFASFHVFKHKENLGSFANSAFLRGIIFQKYDRFIRTDDDAEFSPNFIEYIDKCLMEYEKDPDVIAVTGYSYPIDWQVSKGASILKENFICPMWGIGFWKDKYIQIKQDIDDGCLKDSIPFVIKNSLRKQMLTTCECEYTDLCLSPIFKDTLAAKMTDIATRMYMVIHDKYVIVPIVSKVRNWGFDGSGEYCANITTIKGSYNASNYPYNEQPIDESEDFDIIPDVLNQININRNLLDSFEAVSWKRLLKVRLKMLLYRILGKKIFNAIMGYNKILSS